MKNINMFIPVIILEKREKVFEELEVTKLRKLAEDGPILREDRRTLREDCRTLDDGLPDWLFNS